jgi:hypothetical protein
MERVKAPGGTLSKRKRPSAVESVCCVSGVLGNESWMRAPGMSAPCVSTIVPEMLEGLASGAGVMAASAGGSACKSRQRAARQRRRATLPRMVLRGMGSGFGKLKN